MELDSPLGKVRVEEGSKMIENGGGIGRAWNSRDENWGKDLAVVDVKIIARAWKRPKRVIGQRSVSGDVVIEDGEGKQEEAGDTLPPALEGHDDGEDRTTAFM